MKVFRVLELENTICRFLELENDLGIFWARQGRVSLC